MTTVYIVTIGDYSDKQVIGVYSTQELAEEAVRMYDGNDPDECELDSPVPNYGGRVGWMVVVAHNGNVQWAARDNSIYGGERGWRTSKGVISGLEQVTLYLLAEDQEHAVKIANERRATLIAENLWILGDREATLKNMDQIPWLRGQATEGSSDGN